MATAGVEWLVWILKPLRWIWSAIDVPHKIEYLVEKARQIPRMFGRKSKPPKLSGISKLGPQRVALGQDTKGQPILTVEGTFKVDTITWGTTPIPFEQPFAAKPKLIIWRPDGQADPQPTWEANGEAFTARINSSNQSGEWRLRARGRPLLMKTNKPGLSSIIRGRLAKNS
jgi:hypothetical protein